MILPFLELSPFSYAFSYFLVQSVCSPGTFLSMYNCAQEESPLPESRDVSKPSPFTLLLWPKLSTGIAFSVSTSTNSLKFKTYYSVEMIVIEE